VSIGIVDGGYGEEVPQKTERREEEEDQSCLKPTNPNNPCFFKRDVTGSGL